MLTTITNALPDLTPSEQRVGRWILQHPKDAANITLARLAAECETSEPTIVRFCRHVGLSGFRELAIRLTEALSSPSTDVHRNVSADDSIADAVIKVMDTSIQSLVEMRAQLSSMPVNEAVGAMQDARQIVFAGLGASGQVARDACHKFFRLGIPCTALHDTTVILQYAAIADSRDVLVLLSHSGRWQEFGRAAKTARERGATVIAVTSPDSVFAGEASLLFPCRVVEDTNIFTPMSSRLAQLALLDAIQVALALAQGQVAGDNLRLSKDALYRNTDVRQ
jgi:RpiR family carbohydrate utilization transcriptional regulator